MRKTSINKVKHEYNTHKYYTHNYYTRVSLYLQLYRLIEFSRYNEFIA